MGECKSNDPPYKENLNVCPSTFSTVPCFSEPKDFYHLPYRNGRGHTGFPSEDAADTMPLPAASPEHVHLGFASLGQTPGLHGERTIQ